MERKRSHKFGLEGTREELSLWSVVKGEKEGHLFLGVALQVKPFDFWGKKSVDRGGE